MYPDFYVCHWTFWYIHINHMFYSFQLSFCLCYLTTEQQTWVSASRHDFFRPSFIGTGRLKLVKLDCWVRCPIILFTRLFSKVQNISTLLINSWEQSKYPLLSFFLAACHYLCGASSSLMFRKKVHLDGKADVVCQGNFQIKTQTKNGSMFSLCIDVNRFLIFN